MNIAAYKSSTTVRNFDFRLINSLLAHLYQPIIMSGLVSDEVAEDYKNSLEDLTTNDRFQISNLTVIAKENTEHAMAISRVLENHIRSVGVVSVELSEYRI